MSLLGRRRWRRRTTVIGGASGALGVRDVSRGGVRRLELLLPERRRARLVECPDGWFVQSAGGPPHPARRSVARALADLDIGEFSDRGWVAGIEELATPLGPAAAAGMTPEQRARLASLRSRHPSLYADGPRAQSGGGWFAFIGGLPGGAWVMEYGEVPEQAAAAALDRVEAMLEG